MNLNKFVEMKKCMCKLHRKIHDRRSKKFKKADAAKDGK
jgi:hypothetical protein